MLPPQLKTFLSKRRHGERNRTVTKMVTGFLVPETHKLLHLSPIWATIHHIHLLCTSVHKTKLQTTIFKFQYFKLLTVSPFNRIQLKLCDFNSTVIPTHYKYICILAVTTLKMVTCVVETCRWSLCNKNYIRKIKVHFLVYLINFMLLINAGDEEHTEL
jgi:hypothetical protein